MKNITILKTPKIPIYSENFVYNYYSSKEENINDKKFIVFENEEEYYSIRTNNARIITEPRFITFNMDISRLNNYNRYEISENNYLIASTPAFLSILSNIEILGTTPDNLFDKNKRRQYFNDINFLKQNQIFDNEIDLTLGEDTSEPYNQMIKFFDEEDPENVIPNAENMDFIRYANNTSDNQIFQQRQKNGDSVLIDRSIFRRIKNSNKKIVTSYLEDKQSESLKNLSMVLQQNNIQNLEEGLDNFVANFNQNSIETANRGFDIVNNPSQGFTLFNNNNNNNPENQNINVSQDIIDLVLSRTEVAKKEIFFTKPKILLSTLDFVDNNDSRFRELNELVIGVLVDKYLLENNSKKYLCSKFFNTTTFKDSGNIVVTDKAVKYGKTYIYEARPVHVQSYVSNSESPQRIYYLILGNRTSSFAIKCIERESPLPPSHLEAEYDINKKGIQLKWGLPANRQRDIVNFQVFRRESPFQPYRLIKEFRKINVGVVDNSESGLETPDLTNVEISNFMKFRYLDKDIVSNKTYIYAVCCIDAHGLSSAYSAQVACKFNSLTSNLEIDTISLAGALKQYPNQFLPRKTKFYNFENDVISNTPIIKNKNKMNIYFTPDYRTITKENNDNVKIIDLDTDVDEVNTYSNYFTVSLTDINTLSSAKQYINIKDKEI